MTLIDPTMRLWLGRVLVHAHVETAAHSIAVTALVAVTADLTDWRVTELSAVDLETDEVVATALVPEAADAAGFVERELDARVRVFAEGREAA